MDSSQQSRLISSSPSLSSSIIKEATLMSSENKSQLDLAKNFCTKTAAEIDESNLQGMDAVDTDPGTQTATRSSVLLNPNSSVSVEESVFCIDHILELILRDCDRQTLLNCRLVCRRWTHYGSKSLQRIVTLAFTYKYDNNRPEFPCPYGFGFQLDSNQNYSIEDLTALMNNSTEFPSSSFTFSNNSLGNKSTYTPEPFLNAFGHVIKTIEFQGILSFDHLKQLLLTQAPNLEQLNLSSISILELPLRDSMEDNITPAERAIAMQTRFTESDNSIILENLKVFEGSWSIPKLFTQQILEASPNLVQVSLPSEYLNILVKPINRLHLLKKLQVIIYDGNIEAFEEVANYHEENLALEELEFIKICWSADNADNLCHRVMNVTAKILIASRGLCKKLTCHSFFSRVELLDMPQVKQLTLEYFTDDDDNGLPLKVLPDGVSIGETFPNMKSLEMRGSGKRLTLEKYFGSDKLLPVEGVLSVYWNIFPCGEVNIAVKQSLSKMFPNAKIKMATIKDF